MKRKFVLMSGVVATAGLVLGLSTTAMAATSDAVPVPVKHKVSKPVKLKVHKPVKVRPATPVASKSVKAGISVPEPVAPGQDTSQNAG